MRLHGKGPVKINTQESGLIEVSGRGALCSINLLAAAEIAWTLRSRRDPMDYMAMLVRSSGLTIPDLFRLRPVVCATHSQADCLILPNTE